MIRRSTVCALSVTLWVTAVHATPTHFVGMNTHQPANDMLDAAKDLGVTWIRIDFNWYQIQPSASGSPSFTSFDTMISEAQKRGLKVFPTIGYGPAWASEPDADGKAHNEAPKVGEYEKFCKAAAAHYAPSASQPTKPSITHWGLWNEPNLSFFEGTRQQWIDRVLKEGIKGIKAGCPTCKVLGPELASVGKDYDKWLEDALTQLKSAGLMFDIITWHTYSTFLELKPTWICWDGDLFLHDLDQHRVCFGIHGPLSVREVLLKQGLGSLPVWITETGYTAPISSTTEQANQVTYYRRVLEEQLKRTWWTHTFFYEIVDDNSIADKWGAAVRSGTSPAFPSSYQKKQVWAFLQQVLGKQPAFGGTGTDCNDGLDNDGDKLIDYPKDTGCASASAASEGPKPDAGVADGAPGDGKAPTTDGKPASSDGPRADGKAKADGAGTGDGPGPGTDAPLGSDTGCGCAVPGARGAARPFAIALVLALGWLVFRRRSRGVRGPR